VLDKMSKAFHAKFERFKERGMNRSYSFSKGFGRRKKMKRKIVGFAIVFDVLQERIEELPMFFRNRGSERFNRGELGGKGFGGGGVRKIIHTTCSVRDFGNKKQTVMSGLFYRI
jgi:hypothetical protein